MSLLNTSLFKIDQPLDDDIKKTLQEVSRALSSENYNSVEQIVGYLLTGEPIYITSKHDARHKMRSLDRSKVLEHILREYLK